jgi:hypothetical protein
MFLFQQSGYVNLSNTPIVTNIPEEQRANVGVKSARALLNSDQISESVKKGINLPELEKLLAQKKFDEVNKQINDWVNRFNIRDIFEKEFRNILELESKVLTDTKKKGGGAQKVQTEQTEDKKKKEKQAKVREDALSKAPKTTTPREKQAEKPKPPKIPKQEEQNKVEKKVFTEQGPRQDS